MKDVCVNEKETGGGVNMKGAEVEEFKYLGSTIRGELRKAAQDGDIRAGVSK